MHAYNSQDTFTRREARFRRPCSALLSQSARGGSGGILDCVVGVTTASES